MLNIYNETPQQFTLINEVVEIMTAIKMIKKQAIIFDRKQCEQQDHSFADTTFLKVLENGIVA